MANIDPPTQSIARFAPARAGLRRSPRGTSGAAATRVSTTRNAAIRTAATTRAAAVCGDPQPTTSVRTRPYTSAVRLPVTSSAPATSRLRVPSPRRSVRTARAAMIPATPNRDVDQEDPPPRQGVGEDAAEQRARRAPARERRAPDAEGACPLPRLRERGGQDRQGRRRQHRRAQPLHGPGGHQGLGSRRESAHQAGGREQRQPGDEDPAPAEQVRGAAAEQQEPRERERVGVHHPLEPRRAEPQVGAHRGQRHRHDRHVQDHHELTEAGDRQDRAPACGGGLAHHPDATPLRPCAARGRRSAAGA